MYMSRTMYRAFVVLFTKKNKSEWKVTSPKWKEWIEKHETGHAREDVREEPDPWRRRLSGRILLSKWKQTARGFAVPKPKRVLRRVDSILLCNGGLVQHSLRTSKVWPTVLREVEVYCNPSRRRATTIHGPRKKPPQGFGPVECAPILVAISAAVTFWFVTPPREPLTAKG